VSIVRATVHSDAPARRSRRRPRGGGHRPCPLLSIPLIVAVVALLVSLHVRAFHPWSALKAVVAQLLSVGRGYGALGVWHGRTGPMHLGHSGYGVVTDFGVAGLSPSCWGVDGLRSLHLSPGQRSTRRGKIDGEAIVEVLDIRAASSRARDYSLPRIAALASGLKCRSKCSRPHGVGILLDPRCPSLLVPALVSLLGRRNWWLPFLTGSSRN